MDWRDEGVLLTCRRHGEANAIIEVLTPTRGKHAGVVRGGASHKMAPLLQPGAQLDVAWRARLEDHIGTFTVDPIRSRAAQAMESRLAMAGLNAVVGLLSFCLPEREPHAALYTRSVQVLDLLGQDDIWPLAYLHWERALLDEMGYGLDLTECAATGTTEDLIYVSPKTGRAVSKGAAGIWAHRLLPLPPVLLGQGEAPNAEILQGLTTTGHFLTDHLAPDLGTRPIPDARARLIDRLRRLE